MMIATLTYASTELAAEGAPVDVTVDWTVFIQIGLFVLLALVLKPVLFDPMLKLFEEREKRIEGAKVQARHIDEESATALAKYEKAMDKARAEGNAEREKVRSEGVKTETEILAKVREATARALDEGKRKAHEEAEKVRVVLKQDAQQLAKDLATRVLGREVQG